MTSRRGVLPWVALLIVWTVWGSTYMAIRIVVREVPPFATGGLRFLAAGAVMAIAAGWIERKRPSRRQLLEYAVIGVLLLGGGNALVMWSERSIESGTTALIVATVPLWITLLDGLRPGGQAWTVRGWLGTLIGLAGVALVARPSGGIGREHWLGVLALVAASLSWTLGTLYAQSLPEKLPILTGAAIEMLAGAAAFAVETRVAREPLAPFQSASAGAWGALAYLAVFGSLVGFTAFAYCVNHLPASTVATYAYVNPVVAVALGSLFLGEPLTPRLMAGAVLIVAAVVLTTMRRRPVAPKPVRDARPVAAAVAD